MNIFSRVKNLFTRNVSIDPWYFLFRPNNVATGEFLTEEDVLKVSTIFRCVAILSQGVSTLPLILKKNQEGKKKLPAIEHPLFNVFLFKVNHFQNAVEFWEQMMIALVLRGNAYAQKIYNNGGQLVGLNPLMPDYMRVLGDSNNLLYEYRPPIMGLNSLPTGLSDKVYQFTSDEILHIRAFPKNGIMGIAVVDKMMEAAGMAIAAEKFGAAFFSNGVTPTGILEHPGTLSQEAYDRLKQDFNDKHRDIAKKHGNMILEEGVKWHQMGLTNEQAQFIQTRKFTKEDICTWFGVPAHLVGASDKQPGSSIEQLGIEFLTHSLRPWLVRIEKALHVQCIEEKDWTNYTLEFLTDELLRADMKTRYETHAIAINNGMKSIDEVREVENLNPLPDNLGADYYRPLNMYSLKDGPPAPANSQEKPGAVSTTAGSTGYSPGTPGGEGQNVKKEGARQKLEAFKPMAVAVLERIERRAKKVRENGKNDWGKFDDDTKRDLIPLFQTIRRLVNVSFDESAWSDSYIRWARQGDSLPENFQANCNELLNQVGE